ncbi:MAG: PIN domain-containing protein [Nanoarchaeota archaeon]|jgi:predicted nucleic acid-binding protein|nr:PIN domain-containing protein [Nanoarchaeota archaeon]
MRFVVDTNILFSYFKDDSFGRKMIFHPSFELFSPKFALSEIQKDSDLIMKKCKLSRNEFDLLIDSLSEVVKFIPKKVYSASLDDAEHLCPDIDDVDFFALCLNMNAPLWSNDKLLKSQEKIKVLSTKDIIECFF